MTKNEKDILLLDKCIDHWYENLMILQLNKLSGHFHLTEHYNITSDACACCQRYRNNYCANCPISNKVGEDDCCGTPYQIIIQEIWKPFINYKFLFKATCNQLNFLIELKEELANQK